jgi:hypothetical protein
MNRPLNLFILDSMIEQFDRSNPVPEHVDDVRRESISDQMDSELLSLHLQELKVLKQKIGLLELKIIHQDRELREQHNLLSEVCQATPQDNNGQYDPINQPQAYKIDKYLSKVK